LVAMAVTRREIGDLLVDNGVITPEDLEIARAEREKSGDSITAVLKRLGLAADNQVKNALELEFGVNFVELRRLELDSSILSLLPLDVVKQHLVVAIGRDGARATVAMVDPSDNIALDAVKKCLGGMHVKVVVCLEEDFVKIAKDRLKITFDRPQSPPELNPSGNGTGNYQKTPEAAAKAGIDEQTDPKMPKIDEFKDGDITAVLPTGSNDDFASDLSAAVAALKDGLAASKGKSVLETAGGATGEMSILSDPREALQEPDTAIELHETAEALKEAKAEAESNSTTDTGSHPVVVNPSEMLTASARQPALTQDLSEMELARRAQEEAIVLLANQILGGAIRKHCSNIHITPGARQALVQYRLNGAIYLDRKLPNTIMTALIARYKMMARMSLTERSLPQDGHIKVKSASKEIVCLITTAPSELGEHVIIWIV
jgi:type II secretory ATPase GspE/PulE/Tfp pilus assembly ATPase PilB-like protein